MSTYIFSSESVGEGHPDKVADYISDSILDACLAQDPESRVACETLVKNNQVVLAGEITTQAQVDYEQVVRQAIAEIGYCTPKDDDMFHADTVQITNLLSEQSPDIAQGVNAQKADGKKHEEQGAGDQGIMFGYATEETDELMPAPIMYAHKILQELARLRKSGQVDWLRPDCKSQVAVIYQDGRPVGIKNVVLSTQHTPGISHQEIEDFCINEVIRKVLPACLLENCEEFFINPTGSFIIGGPHGDSGLTGRKIIVDTYGGIGRHGGGAFSGKDPSKVDRSAAYMCRWVAKNVVAAQLAEKCELQVAYAIGHNEPVSLRIDTFGTAHIPEKDIEQAVKKVFSFKPADMIQELGLKSPLYKETTHYGHFTKAHLPWEQTNKVEALKAALNALKA